MAQSDGQTIEQQMVEEIRADLDQLSLDLIAAKRQLASSRSSKSPSGILKPHLTTTSPRASQFASTSTASRVSLKSGSENDRDKILPPRPGLGARISSAFKIPKLNRRKRSIPVERQGLLDRKDSMASDSFSPDETDGPSRQGSMVSDTTLVDEDSAGYLLDLLAPLITAIQRLAPRIVQLSPSPSTLMGIEQRPSSNTSVKDEFLNLCADVSQLLEGLKQIGVDGGVDVEDEHENEMRGLMLTALVKKVDIEVQGVRNARHQLSESDAAPTVVDSMTQALKLSIPGEKPSPSSSASSSPLAHSRSNNPFILHSNSLRQKVATQASPGADAIFDGRKASVSVPIGVSAGGPRHAMPAAAPGSFSTFVGGAQSSLWATNVRLASFQNSLLFSPSPIAVRRVVGHAAR